MKYLVNLACDGHWGEASSFSDGTHAFEVTAKNMDDAKNKVIARAKIDGFYNADNVWSANIVRLEAGGRIDTGSDLIDILSADRKQTVKLCDGNK